MRTIILAAILPLVLAVSCGTVAETVDGHPDSLEYTGIVQVLEQGTRSETVILEETRTGSRYSLVGESARELIRLYGSVVTVVAVPTEEGWTVRPEYPRLLVLDHWLSADDEGGDSREY